MPERPVRRWPQCPVARPGRGTRSTPNSRRPSAFGSRPMTSMPPRQAATRLRLTEALAARFARRVHARLAALRRDPRPRAVPQCSAPAAPRLRVWRWDAGGGQPHTPPRRRQPARHARGWRRRRSPHARLLLPRGTRSCTVAAFLCA